ncbi:MAG: divalent-cation tolerance protein CutA [Candidatus Omnitrophica bacterium]|nr:divalent-cation tolerance protein CutA [Candidatus Omnitrophota bacterium]
MHTVIFITCAHKKEAENIAKALIKNKLAACVNIVDKINSLFWWQGKVDCAQEVLLIIKSKRTKLNKIIKLVKSRHSYQVPEIIALPIIGGYKPYLNWINDSCR